MVRFEEETTSNKQSITKELFLKSLGKWYPKGIELRVDEVSDRVFEDRFNKNKDNPSCILFVTFEIIGNMKKCMSYVVENGEYVLDDFDGKMKEVIDGTNQKVKATFKMIPLYDDGDDENPEFKIMSSSGFYPLLKFGMVQNGIIDEVKPRKSLIVTFEEILDSLEDLEFIATSKHIKSKKYAYDLLVPKKSNGNLDDFADSKADDGFEIVNPSD